MKKNQIGQSHSEREENIKFNKKFNKREAKVNESFHKGTFKEVIFYERV